MRETLDDEIMHQSFIERKTEQEKRGEKNPTPWANAKNQDISFINSSERGSSQLPSRQRLQ